MLKKLEDKNFNSNFVGQKEKRMVLNKNFMYRNLNKYYFLLIFMVL